MACWSREVVLKYYFQTCRVTGLDKSESEAWHQHSGVGIKTFRPYITNNTKPFFGTQARLTVAVGSLVGLTTCNGQAQCSLWTGVWEQGSPLASNNPYCTQILAETGKLEGSWDSFLEHEGYYYPSSHWPMGHSEWVYDSRELWSHSLREASSRRSWMCLRLPRKAATGIFPPPTPVVLRDTGS